MKKIWIGILLALASTAVALIPRGQRIPVGTVAPGVDKRVVLYYRDPMHPSYKSDRPGTAPDCGMPLEPIYSQDNGSAGSVSEAKAGIRLSPDQQRLAGVRLGRVERSLTTQRLRTFGRIVVDETRVIRVSAGGAGWVKRTFPGTATDDVVRRGQPLVTLYGRDFTTAQRAFIYAMRASENPPPAATGETQDAITLTLQEARLSLQDLGLSADEIDQLAKSRQVAAEVTLRAPGPGVVVTRNAFENQTFDRGAELFRIADLSHVWITADFRGEEQYIREGATAIVSVPNRGTRTWRAHVTDALPRYDTESRTLKVRLEADNPGLILKPDMLVDVEFSINHREAITVPADAIVTVAARQMVFLEDEGGLFYQRDVKTGTETDGSVEVLDGLKPGDMIVISGAFLLDSELRRRSHPGGT